MFSSSIMLSLGCKKNQCVVAQNLASLEDMRYAILSR